MFVDCGGDLPIDELDDECDERRTRASKRVILLPGCSDFFAGFFSAILLDLLLIGVEVDEATGGSNLVPEKRQ